MNKIDRKILKWKFVEASTSRKKTLKVKNMSRKMNLFQTYIILSFSYQNVKINWCSEQEIVTKNSTQNFNFTQ